MKKINSKGELVDMSQSEIAEITKSREIPVEQKREQASMPSMEFAILSASKGWITDAEALAWGSKTSIPALADDIIKLMPADEQLRMRLVVLTSETIGRNNSMMAPLMNAQGVEDAEMDELFGIN